MNKPRALVLSISTIFAFISLVVWGVYAAFTYLPQVISTAMNPSATTKHFAFGVLITYGVAYVLSIAVGILAVQASKAMRLTKINMKPAIVAGILIGIVVGSISTIVIFFSMFSLHY